MYSNEPPKLFLNVLLAASRCKWSLDLGWFPIWYAYQDTHSVSEDFAQQAAKDLYVANMWWLLLYFPWKFWQIISLEHCGHIRCWISERRWADDICYLQLPQAATTANANLKRHENGRTMKDKNKKDKSKYCNNSFYCGNLPSGICKCFLTQFHICTWGSGLLHSLIATEWPGAHWQGACKVWQDAYCVSVCKVQRTI